MNTKERYEQLATAAEESNFEMDKFNAAVDDLWNNLNWFQKFCFNVLSKLDELQSQVNYKIDQRKLIR